MFLGTYGKDAKEASAARDARREQLNTAAKSAFYDTEAGDAFRADLDKRMAETGARTGAPIGKTTMGANAYATAARVAPMSTVGAAKMDLARANEMRAGQDATLARFGESAMGRGPSVAGIQMQKGGDAAIMAAARLRGSANRRVAPSMLANVSGKQLAAGMSEAASASAATKMREAAEGGQQFGALSGAMREGDINAAIQQAGFDHAAGTFNAGALNAADAANAGFMQKTAGFNASTAQKQAKMNQAIELANVERDLRMRGMNDAAIAQYLSAYQKQFQADKTAKMGFHDWSQDLVHHDERLAFEKQKAGESADAATVSSIARIFGGVAMSDERQKKNVTPASPAISRFLDDLKAYAYEYKNPELEGAGHGTHVSPMAQDLEATELGRSAVKQDADGIKRVDYGKLAGVSLAGLVEVHERLKKLEARKGKAA